MVCFASHVCLQFLWCLQALEELKNKKEMTEESKSYTAINNQNSKQMMQQTTSVQPAAWGYWSVYKRNCGTKSQQKIYLLFCWWLDPECTGNKAQQPQHQNKKNKSKKPPPCLKEAAVPDFAADVWRLTERNPVGDGEKVHHNDKEVTQRAGMRKGSFVVAGGGWTREAAVKNLLSGSRLGAARRSTRGRSFDFGEFGDEPGNASCCVLSALLFLDCTMIRKRWATWNGFN